jgi:hypothetical protein
VGPALRRIRTGLKAELAEQSREHAVYLATAVRLWEMAHNEHPDLRGYVEAEVEPDHGTVLLSALQASTLAALLEAEGLRGSVSVAVAPTSFGGRPGQALRLLVNGTQVVLPPSSWPSPVTLDPLPPVLLFAAWSALTAARRQDVWLPLGWALAIAAGYGATACYLGFARRSDRENTRANQPYDPRLGTGTAAFAAARPGDVGGQSNVAGTTAAARELAAAVVMAIGHGAVTAAFARNRRSLTGVQLFPMTFGIAPAAAVLAANWPRASQLQRASAIAALAATAVAGYRAAPAPRSGRDFARSLVWPAAALLGCSGVMTQSTQHSKAVSSALQAKDEEAEALAYKAGAESVLSLVREALAEAEAALPASALARASKVEVRRRLASVRAAIGQP